MALLSLVVASRMPAHVPTLFPLDHQTCNIALPCTACELREGQRSTRKSPDFQREQLVAVQSVGCITDEILPYYVAILTNEGDGGEHASHRTPPWMECKLPERQ